MKLTDNQKEDLIATRDYWAFAAENGVDSKSEWSGYDRIEGLLNFCYFCEYIRITPCFECEFNESDGFFSIDDDECYCIECKNCYLFVKNMCGRNGSIWNLLSDENDIEKRKQYAKQILDVIEEFIKREV